MTKPKRTTGTREWSEHSINCGLGCSNACLYCYARDQALRWGRIKSGAEWATERPADMAIIHRNIDYKRTYSGVVMFPTTHDLTALNFKQVLAVLGRLLDAGNRVLFVTKPRLVFVGDLVKVWKAAVAHHAHLNPPWLDVRCSITCLDDSVRRFWEPGAPSILERCECLQHLHSQGIGTSVSIEPNLQPDRVHDLVEIISPYVTGEIWVGKCNDLRRRTAWLRAELVDKVAEADRLGVDLYSGVALWAFDEAVAALEAQQTDAAVLAVVERLKGNPKIRWKDSYREVIERAGC